MRNKERMIHLYSVYHNQNSNNGLFQGIHTVLSYLSNISLLPITMDKQSFFSLLACLKPDWMTPSMLPNNTKYILVTRSLILTALNIAQVLGRGHRIGLLLFWICGELLAMSRVPSLTILYPKPRTDGLLKFYLWEKIFIKRQCA